MTPRLNLLIVDDNAVDRESIRRMLPPHAVVREAATGQEAREELARNQPGLVLLDYRLPDTDGTDLLPEFVARNVPVVMFTEVEQPDAIVVAMQRGAEGYLVKGALTRDALCRTITHALEKAALRQQVAEHQRALVEQSAALEVRNQEIRDLAAALTFAEQAERHRIAELLHDDLQQLLVSAQIHLHLLLSAEPDKRETAGQFVRDALDKAVSCTRNLVAEMTPPVLDNDLEVALHWLADHLSQLHHIAVTVVAESTGTLPSRDVQVLLIQIVRELVFNCVKHAGVTDVCIRIRKEPSSLVVTVEDCGKGFDPDEVQRRAAKGFGLHSISERLNLIGGRFDVVSHLGEGTWARVTVPA